MNSNIKRLIDIAYNEVGYLEKASNSQLDFKTANAGSGNYTKYNRDMMKYSAGIYVNGYAWCDTFVDWCFVQAFGSEKAKEMLGGWSAYTPTSAGYYKNRGLWHTKNPQPGDQIFFNDSKGGICHTGIVYKVDSKYIYTIEGNTSSASGVVANGGGVAKKSYSLTYNRIAGYGRPQYPADLREEDEQMYNTVTECPEWSRPYVRKAIELKWIMGTDTGALQLTDTKIWCLVILLRSQNIMK